MTILSTEPNVDHISSIIFDIASTNSFYSGIYALIIYAWNKWKGNFLSFVTDSLLVNYGEIMKD